MRLTIAVVRSVGSVFVAFAHARRGTKAVVIAVLAVAAIVGTVANHHDAYPVHQTPQEQRQVQEDKRTAERYAREGKVPSQHGCTTSQVVVKTTTGHHPSKTTTVTRKCS